MKTELSRIIKADANGLFLKLHVLPNSKKNSIVGLYGDPPRLKVKLAAVPEKGKANKALIKYFSKVLGIEAQALILNSGDFSGKKELFIKKLGPNEFIEIVENYLKK